MLPRERGRSCRRLTTDFKITANVFVLGVLEVTGEEETSALVGRGSYRLVLGVFR